MKYIDNKWQEISQGDVFKITKIEGQVCQNRANSYVYVFFPGVL